MACADVSCTPAPIPPPCKNPPTMPRTCVIWRSIAERFSRTGAFRQVDSRQFPICALPTGGTVVPFAGAPAVWAQPDRTPVQNRVIANAAFFISVLFPGHPPTRGAFGLVSSARLVPQNCPARIRKTRSVLRRPFDVVDQQRRAGRIGRRRNGWSSGPEGIGLAAVRSPPKGKVVQSSIACLVDNRPAHELLQKVDELSQIDGCGVELALPALKSPRSFLLGIRTSLPFLEILSMRDARSARNQGDSYGRKH
jgi:hypothetical protein